jgi:hypothetical protein
VVTRDPNDERVRATALCGRATSHVPPDDDLLSLQQDEAMTIMALEAFIALVQGNAAVVRIPPLTRRTSCPELAYDRLMTVAN